MCRDGEAGRRVRQFRSHVAAIVGRFGCEPLFAVGSIPVDVGALAIVPKRHGGRGCVVDPDTSCTTG